MAKAKLLFKNGDYSGAEIHLLNSLKYFDNRNLEKEYLCLINLGLISQEFKDYNQALTYVNQALHFIEANKNFSEIDLAIVLNNLGRIYIDLRNYKAAEKCFTRALRTTKLQVKSPTIYALLLENLAVSKFNQKVINAKIEKLIVTSLRIKDSINYDRVSSRVNYSTYLLLKKDSLKALQVAKRGYKIAKELRNPQEILLIIKHLMQIDKVNTSAYVVPYLKIIDSLKIAERKAIATFARIQYETDQIKYDKEKAIKQKQIILLAFGMLFLIIVSGSIIKHFKTRQKHLYFAQEQQYANEKIYDLMLDQQDKFERIRFNEQKRIARELHDGIINRLVSTRLNLFELTKNVKISQNSIRYIEQIQCIEKDIKDISYNLDSNSHKFSKKFDQMLLYLIEEQNFNNIINYQADKDINWESIDVKSKVHIYRILQESLLNMLKHSGATKIDVYLKKSYSEIILDIKDNGRGFIIDKVHQGMGLKNMKYRAKEINAKIFVESKINQGTKITIIIPNKQ